MKRKYIISVKHSGTVRVYSMTDAELSDKAFSEFDDHSYWSTTRDGLIDCYGEDDIPEKALEIVDVYGCVVNVNGEWMSTHDAPAPTEWALETIGHDMRVFHWFDSMVGLLKFVRNYDDYKSGVVAEQARGLAEYENATVADAADYLGLAESTIKNQVANGKIDAKKFGQRLWSVEWAEIFRYEAENKGNVGNPNFRGD